MHGEGVALLQDGLLRLRAELPEGLHRERVRLLKGVPRRQRLSLLPLAALPASTAVPAVGIEQDEERSWSRPITNPSRNALIASAAEKLAESARRISELQARFDIVIGATPEDRDQDSGRRLPGNGDRRGRGNPRPQ